MLHKVNGKVEASLLLLPVRSHRICGNTSRVGTNTRLRCTKLQQEKPDQPAEEPLQKVASKSFNLPEYSQTTTSSPLEAVKLLHISPNSS